MGNYSWIYSTICPRSSDPLYIVTYYFKIGHIVLNKMGHTERFISYRKYILKITQPSKYRCTQLQYRFARISEAPSIARVLNIQEFDGFLVEKLRIFRVMFQEACFDDAFTYILYVQEVVTLQKKYQMFTSENEVYTIF